MSSTITISTSLLKQQNPSLNVSDFSVDFNPPINLNTLAYELALTRFQGWNSVRNFVGCSVVWSHDNALSFIVTPIPDGLYSIEDLNTWFKGIQSDLNVTDTTTNPTTYGIEFIANYNTNRAVLQISNFGARVFIVDLTIGFIDTILGFSPTSIFSTTSGDTIADFSNGVDSFLISCDLIRNSYSNSKSSNVLYSFQPKTPPNSSIDEQPLHLQYLQVNKSQISQLKIKITDQNDNLLDFAGEDLVITLSLRPIK